MSPVNAQKTLPQEYRRCEKIDLIKNRKQLLLVNGLAVVLAVLLIAAGILWQPEGASALFDFKGDPWGVALKFLVAGIGLVVYIIGHEAVHGIFMWHFSHVKPNFGLSLSYAYAGSHVYFGKTAYLVIALAPVVLWTILLGLLCSLLPGGWFWPVWFVQITNVSGAAGDLFVFGKILRYPSTVLVQDTGTAMTVYLPA
ncbi:MAG: DUF3267 domain-containing protein [Clostridia bacterium]|nr:DUF3267 domain-containing protein [Clostridia bacterium]